MYTEAAPGLAVLDWLRQDRRLTGTKEGCKEGDCGACVVLVGERLAEGLTYRPVTSCLLPLGELAGRHLVTIEGLNLPGGELTALQQAVVEEGAAQCGFCTPGIIVSLTHCLLDRRDQADLAAMKNALGGHLCRCTGYASLKRAAVRVRGLCPPAPTLETALPELIARRVLPGYFAGIPGRLRALRAEMGAGATTSPGGRRIAGGTDLYVQQGEELPTAPVQFLNLDPCLAGVSREPGRLRVGAATTFAAFAEIPEVRQRIPRINEYMARIASLQIRNRATLGGNVVNASPIGDLAILLLALGAEAAVHGPGGERILPLHQLYLGYKRLALADGEIISAFRIPMEPGDVRVHFEKVSKRKSLDIASVNSAIKLALDHDRIRSASLAIGGVAPIPKWLPAASAWLAGRTITPAMVHELQNRIEGEVAPIDDIRGSAAYKRLLARQLTAAHFVELFPDWVSAEAFA